MRTRNGAAFAHHEETALRLSRPRNGDLQKCNPHSGQVPEHSESAGVYEDSAPGDPSPLPISLSAISDAHNVNRVPAALAKDNAPIANPESILRRIEAMQLPDVAGFRFQKTSQRIEQPQRGLAINRANIGARLIGKDSGA